MSVRLIPVMSLALLMAGGGMTLAQNSQDNGAVIRPPESQDKGAIIQPPSQDKGMVVQPPGDTSTGQRPNGGYRDNNRSTPNGNGTTPDGTNNGGNSGSGNGSGGGG